MQSCLIRQESKGLLNVINGNKETVEKLIEDKRIRAVSFVGSTPVAKKIYENSGKYGKRCQALGGAKNHALVLSDANLEYTTNQLISAAFGSSGQRCMALSVAMVQRNIKDKFIEILKNKTKSLKVGLDIKDSNNFGPLVSLEHMDKVKSYIDMAESEGCDIIVDGRNVHKGKNSNDGYFGANY